MTVPAIRHLAPAVAAGLGLSLLSALPAGAHGLASGGLLAGAGHPLLGLDHLLLLLGVGAAAAVAGTALLWVALGAAVLGSLIGAFGGALPGAELVAALAVSALGLALVASQGSQRAGAPTALALVLAAGVAVHALLHGQEASASGAANLLGWWLGAGLASVAVVGASFAVLRQGDRRWARRLAAALGLAGGVLALAPLA